MNTPCKTDLPKKETVDFTTVITIICHVMALYTIRPCEPLAININRHIKVVLNSTASDSLGEWKGTFEQLLRQWEIIAKRHVNKAATH